MVTRLSGAQSVLTGGANLLNTDTWGAPKRNTMAPQIDMVAYPTFDLGHMVVVHMHIDIA
jgi:hypothetical protein